MAPCSSHCSPSPKQKPPVAPHQISRAASFLASSTVPSETPSGTPSLSDSVDQWAMSTPENQHEERLATFTLNTLPFQQSSATDSSTTGIRTPPPEKPQHRKRTGKAGSSPDKRPVSSTGVSSYNSNGSTGSTGVRGMSARKSRENRRGRRKSPNSNLPCNICNQLYSRKDNLRAHQRVHSGEKPYCCAYCGAYFRWLGALRTHESLHVRQNDAARGDCADDGPHEAVDVGDVAGTPTVATGPSSVVQDAEMETMFNSMEAEEGARLKVSAANSSRNENLVDGYNGNGMDVLGVFGNGALPANDVESGGRTSQEDKSEGLDEVVVVSDEYFGGNLLMPNLAPMWPLVLDDMGLGGERGSQL